ncbi:MAG: transposase [Acidobacteriaceae bacterium]|nr:transposase [Acidobacteriaceae bacterium]
MYDLALGYEGRNDHDQWRHSPLPSLLAGKSALNRLERSLTEPTRGKKINSDPDARDHRLVDLFLEAFPQPTRQCVLNLGATDLPLHGQQEHGYERNRLDYVLGLARNSRLERLVAPWLASVTGPTRGPGKRPDPAAAPVTCTGVRNPPATRSQAIGTRCPHPGDTRPRNTASTAMRVIWCSLYLNAPISTHLTTYHRQISIPFNRAPPRSRHRPPGAIILGF